MSTDRRRRPEWRPESSRGPRSTVQYGAVIAGRAGCVSCRVYPTRQLTQPAQSAKVPTWRPGRAYASHRRSAVMRPAHPPRHAPRRRPWRPGVDAAKPARRTRRTVGRSTGEVVHRPFPDGRAATAFDVGPETRRAARGARIVRTDRDVSPRHPNLRTDAAPGGAMDRLALLRAVSTGDNAHSSSGYYMMTGVPHQPMNVENANPGAPNNWPTLGALVQRVRGNPGPAPTAIRLPHRIFNTDGSVWPGQDSGFLGRDADPWLLRCEPGSATMRSPRVRRVRRGALRPSRRPRAPAPRRQRASRGRGPVRPVGALRPQYATSV